MKYQAEEKLTVAELWVQKIIEQRQKGKMRTGRCVSCHAPIAGGSKELVKCPYCDTEQSVIPSVKGGSVR